MHAHRDFFFEKEPLNMQATIKRSQYYVGEPRPRSTRPSALIHACFGCAAGDTIPLRVRIDNKSSKLVRAVKVALFKREEIK